MTRSIRIAAATILALVIFSEISHAQDTDNRAAKSLQVRIKGTEPSVFLSVSRVTNGNDPQGDIVMRLQNNTRWRLCISQYSGTPRAGESLVDYYIKESDGRTVLRATRSDVFYLMFLKPGQSVSFSVPRDQLTLGRHVAVRFNYEWEVAGDAGPRSGEPMHLVEFHHAELPSALR